MQEPRKGQTTGSTRSQTGGSAGTSGRAGYDQDENARVADTSPGDVRTGSQATVGRQGGPGMQKTATERGTAGFENIQGMQGQSRSQTSRQGGMYESESMTRGRGAQESEEAGMWQTSMMLREAHEEGDPEFQRREEDLHARQQDLGQREQSLREREGQLRTREQSLRERQSRFTGETGGLGATDYQDYRIRNDR